MFADLTLEEHTVYLLDSGAMDHISPNKIRENYGRFYTTKAVLEETIAGMGNKRGNGESLLESYNRLTSKISFLEERISELTRFYEEDYIEEYFSDMDDKEKSFFIGLLLCIKSLKGLTVTFSKQGYAEFIQFYRDHEDTFKIYDFNVEYDVRSLSSCVKLSHSEGEMRCAPDESFKANYLDFNFFTSSFPTSNIGELRESLERTRQELVKLSPSRERIMARKAIADYFTNHPRLVIDTQEAPQLISMLIYLQPKYVLGQALKGLMEESNLPSLKSQSPVMYDDNEVIGKIVERVKTIYTAALIKISEINENKHLKRYFEIKHKQRIVSQCTGFLYLGRKFAEYCGDPSIDLSLIIAATQYNFPLVDSQPSSVVIVTGDSDIEIMADALNRIPYESCFQRDVKTHFIRRH